MAPIATYVFFDLETSGLPKEELNRTRITELSMVAVKRDHLLETPPGLSPRVQHKLTLCFNPGRLIQPGSSEVTGLTNELLEHESKFNKETFNMINTFLSVLTKPVCLIAHNGEQFDFPIFKNHIMKLHESLQGDLMCADCYHAFYDIMEAAKKSPEVLSEVTTNENKDTTDNVALEIEVKHGTESNALADNLKMKIQNEMTPKQQRSEAVPTTPRKNEVGESSSRHNNRISKARRKFPFSKGCKPKDSYKLKDIYERLFKKPAVDAHRAENDCILALECSIATAKDFVKWVDENHRPFQDVNAMTLGVPLGD